MVSSSNDELVENVNATPLAWHGFSVIENRTHRYRRENGSAG
jgi:hypothetical protein